jgi:hypothetical protein
MMPKKIGRRRKRAHWHNIRSRGIMVAAIERSRGRKQRREGGVAL